MVNSFCTHYFQTIKIHKGKFEFVLIKIVTSFCFLIILGYDIE